LPRRFEAAAEEDVTSPTFTLVHEYRGPRANLYHIDLYRIDTQRELETLGLDDLRDGNSILLIEWGEKFPRLVRERDVEISLERDGESGWRDQDCRLTLAGAAGRRNEDTARMRRRAPLAHHREKDRGGEEGEGESLVSHHLYYPRTEKRLQNPMML
jgi:tRNA A37 threonylcarbamoyladenosine biosynthesis protein TsaE